MQFNHNADHPAVNPLDGSPRQAPTASPPEFPEVQPTACARITTRIFHPQRNQVATVQNVLVKTVASAANQSSDVSWSSDDMSSDDDDDGNNNNNMTPDEDMSMRDDNNLHIHAATASTENEQPRAYWIQRTIREAIYGRVWLAIVLKKRDAQQAAMDAAEWQVTGEFCAVKEMSWQHIRKERNRLAEDPIKEVSAMQYLKRWHAYTRQTKNNQSSQQQQTDPTAEAFRIVLETNIMMPLDLLTDDKNLYSIMPYCNGGELFERLDMDERFTEGEARYWMYQVLNVSQVLVCIWISYCARLGD